MQAPGRHLASPAESGRLPPWHVLVADGDACDRESLVKLLRRHGHQVMSVSTGTEALQVYEGVDIVLLGLEFSDLDGLEVCGRIRAASSIPMIAVTGRGTEADRVLGLRAGVDDYIVKPYGYYELMARICAVMRRVRARPKSARVLEHESLRICAISREVWLGTRRIDVTHKEFELLFLLASRPDTVFSRRQIMQDVWADSWSRRTVDTHVSSIRRKLGGRNWIITVRGVGFRLGGSGAGRLPA